MGTAPTVPLSDTTFGATVNGVDLRTLDDIAFAPLYQAWLTHGLLVFPSQHLDRDEQEAFARRFETLEFSASPLANVDQEGRPRATDGSDDMMKILVGNMGWHHDSTCMPVQAKGAVFSAEVVPRARGATGWADTAAACEALDPATRSHITTLTANHSQALLGHDGTLPQTACSGYGFCDGPVSVRPLFQTHLETGRTVLTISRQAYPVGGLNPDASTRLLRDLVDHTCRPPRVHHHQWEAGDVAVWDNRRLLNQATPWPFDQPRVIWHTPIAGDPDSEASLSAS